MSDAPRTSLLARAKALLAGPFFLGRKAVADLAPAVAALTARPEPQAPALRPLPILPPEHAVKRRG